MKKLLLALFVMGFMIPFCANAQDTIVGWTFPQALDTSAYSNFGIASNLGTRFIAAEDTGAVERTITWTNGVTDYAATAEEWTGGDSVKFWSIKFKAQGYENLVVYSRQRSGGNNPGPKYFKLQYRFSGGEYMDIPGSDTITVANDWTTGVVSNLALPADCNDTSVSIYLRWLMITNTASNGSTVNDSGISKIDDIFILGSPVSSGLNQNNAEITLNIYPNPASDFINVESAENTVIRVMDIVGNVVSETLMGTGKMRLNVSNLSSGLYFLSATDPQTAQTVTRKIVVK